MPEIGKENFDVRLERMNLESPTKRKAYQNHLKKLPDEAKQADWTRPWDPEVPAEESNENSPE